MKTITFCHRTFGNMVAVFEILNLKPSLSNSIEINFKLDTVSMGLLP
jgi:hypothetical protein